MRITNQWVINAFIRQANKNNTALSDIQSKISSGYKHLRASESPVDNALIMQHRTEIFENRQFTRNVEHTTEWYNNVDSSLVNLESAIQRIRELAVQGANDTLVQDDRDAIAKEIDELLHHIVDVGNTKVAGQYIFAGHDVDKRPFEIVYGDEHGYNNNIVTFSTGEIRSDINKTRPIGIVYHGDDKRILTEIDRGTLIEKSVTGQEIFFKGAMTPIPGFSYDLPPLEKSLPLSVLNAGEGVQPGLIIITDHNGVEHKVDLNYAYRIDDVIEIINNTRSFQAGLEEVPSDTAAALGLYRTAGTSSTLFGLSDPEMITEKTSLANLNNGLGVPDGYLNINARDGRTFRVDITGFDTVEEVVDAISAVDGGTAFDARFDMINRRIEINDITNGSGELSISSTRSQLYIKDLEPHVAEDLGILRDVGSGDRIYSTFDPNILTEKTPLEFANDGLGIERGYIDITGRDGVTTTIDLTAVHDMQSVIDAINNTPGIEQTASFDADTKRLVIEDNSIPNGTDSFRIEENQGNEPIGVREITTIAQNLGLLKKCSGNTVVGDTLASTSGIPVTEDTALADLDPRPEIGFIVIRGADNERVEIDLTDAATIGDVVEKINATEKFEATFDATNNRFVISDPLALQGNYGLRVEERTNPARDLGFIDGAMNHTTDTITGAAINVKALPTLNNSIDLSPAITRYTELESLNSSRTLNNGVNLGHIRITDRAGQFAAIDLRGCKTIGDVLDKINDTDNGLYIEARINYEQNGIEIIDKNQGATGKLEVIDVESSSALDLGIRGVSYESSLVGKDVDPSLSFDTPVSALRVNDGGVQFGKIFVQSGEQSGEIDLTGVQTVGDIIDRLSNSDLTLNMQAWISEDGKGINITNTKDQPYIKFSDVKGEPTTASSLGLATSPSLFSTIIDLRDNLLRSDAAAISNKTLQDIDQDLKRVLDLHTEVGAKTNRVTAVKEKQENITLNLRKMLSTVEDIDMTEAIIKMTELEIAYQAALQTGAKIMQTTLLDFLR